MIFKDYYRILGLDTNKVMQEQIKTAYREQAKKYHPDVNVGSKTAEDRFKDINEAYRVLSNASTKRKYDRMWNAHIGKKQKIKYEESKRTKDAIFSDFFQMFFGNMKEEQEQVGYIQKQKKKAERGEDVETQITISLEEAFYGANKKIALRTVEGNMKTFEVKIPAGIRNNEKIRLIGQGKSGKNGGKNGDLFIRINLKENEKFKIKGYDLYTDLFISPWEAALGTKAKITGVDEELTVIIPKGIQTGQELRMKGKGYKDGKGSRGDLIANIKVMVPQELTEIEKELFTKLSQESKFNPRIKA